MKKFLFILFGVFAFSGAFAAGENIPTSKSYVDSKLGDKQDIIPANGGAPRVLTNTGTAGEYGTKGIYDANGDYSAQQNALVDAQTMNAGVQNAIDSEFQCIEWLDPNDHSSDCLLFNIFGETGKSILPTGFTALEYIESTEQQYIDTNVPWANISRFKGKAKQKRINGINKVIIGSDRGCNVDGFWGTRYFGGQTNWYWTDVLPTELAQFDMHINSDSVWEGFVNNVHADGVSSTYFTGTATIMGNKVSCHINRQFNGFVWYIQLIDDNGLYLFNGIPARRDSDGEIGMYDTVSNTFFTNAGTGEFIAGPVVNLYIPAGQ